MMSQEEQTLEALEQGELTALDALKRFGCFRLAARIHKLRQKGHNITSKIKRLANGKRLAVYTLEKE